MLNKETFLKFIEKYYLNGIIESAIIEVEDSVLKTTFKSLEGDLRGHIEVQDFKLKDAEIGCYSTSSLVKMLGIVNNDINITLNKRKDSEEFLNIVVEDTKQRKFTYATCELDLIDRDGKKSTVKEYEAVVVLNQEIIEDILKSISALNTNVTFLKKDDKFYAVVGYSQNNEDNIQILLDTDGEVDENFTHMTFSQPYIKNILEVNKKRFTQASLSFSMKGMLRIEFIDVNSIAEYWVVKLQD